jgi:hypothetical protein
VRYTKSAKNWKPSGATVFGIGLPNRAKLEPRQRELYQLPYQDARMLLVNVGRGEARFALTLAYWQVGEIGGLVV